MVQPSSASKNLWVAASDGDIERVRDLIEREGMTPNDKDSNAYTPMHAAASYHHFDLLTYLLASGGDINITDEEGETPLFTVESVDAARWLVEHGADAAHENAEGQTAADYLEDDHPEIAAYLRSLSDAGAGAGAGAAATGDAVDAYASQRAAQLMDEAQRAMAEAAAKGEDPELALQAIVQRAVQEGLDFGEGLGEADGGAKRSRTDQ